MTQCRCTSRLPEQRSTRSPPISGSTATSLCTWLDAVGTGTKTNANGNKAASPIAASESATAASGLSDAERIRVLEHENAKLREEREILRKAARYFA